MTAGASRLYVRMRLANSYCNAYSTPYCTAYSTAYSTASTLPLFAARLSFFYTSGMWLPRRAMRDAVDAASLCGGKAQAATTTRPWRACVPASLRQPAALLADDAVLLCRVGPGRPILAQGTRTKGGVERGRGISSTLSLQYFHLAHFAGAASFCSGMAFAAFLLIILPHPHHQHGRGGQVAAAATAHTAHAAKERRRRGLRCTVGLSLHDGPRQPPEALNSRANPPSLQLPSRPVLGEVPLYLRAPCTSSGAKQGKDAGTETKGNEL